MTTPPLLLLPGLDGTGSLFRPFLGVLPREIVAEVVSYPKSELLNYDQLTDIAKTALLKHERVCILAESFSGPIAIRLGEAFPDRVERIVLVNSFATTPVPRGLLKLARVTVKLLPINTLGIRIMLLGFAALPELVQEVKRAIQGVPRRTIGYRLGLLEAIDVRESLANCNMPMVYIHGSDDRLVPDFGPTLSSINPRVKQCAIPGPHLLVQTNPGGVLDAIRQFAAE